MDLGFIPDPGEQVLRVVHRHFIDVVPSVLIAIFLTLTAAGLAYLAGREPANLPFPPSMVLLLMLIMIVLAFVIFTIGFYAFRRNILVFTNMHLVQVEQIGLFNRRVSQLSFERVQDASGESVGVLATILDYGDVTIQTAGEQEKFVFHHAPHPARLADEALEWRNTCRTLHAQGQGPTPPPTEPID